MQTTHFTLITIRKSWDRNQFLERKKQLVAVVTKLETVLKTKLFLNWCLISKYKYLVEKLWLLIRH